MPKSTKSGKNEVRMSLLQQIKSARAWKGNEPLLPTITNSQSILFPVESEIFYLEYPETHEHVATYIKITTALFTNQYPVRAANLSLNKLWPQFRIDLAREY